MADSNEEGMNTDTNRSQNMDTTPACAVSHVLSFTLLGDNLDKNVKAILCQIATGINHYIFHLCAVRDRIDYQTITWLGA